ncbi:HNH endonuclease [Pleomorphomonas carboxyditropha]|uniref:HNH nuclease domain-containing protein n=1 Tax=Pleomorphomonas carboxyditropha TaxID=2023338 RepID=A0A2G9WZW9_9HYPH|nr:HNH endonuclease [Pleomorphomonas carboxyditropha]PIO99660.1 hypothetical protein CJ014_10170 [Pleomorphomonas carboxyditropha]
MPTRPPRIAPCCGLTIAAGELCPCQRRRQQEARRAVDAKRPSATARGYDAAWRKVRSQFLAAHPRCVECGAAATEVDHIKPVAERPDLRLKWSNLRSFCKSCHSRRTARDQGFACQSTTQTANGHPEPTSRPPTPNRGVGNNFPAGRKTEPVSIASDFSEFANIFSRSR